jgi:hypothetical protein
VGAGCWCLRVRQFFTYPRVIAVGGYCLFWSCRIYVLVKVVIVVRQANSGLLLFVFDL